jgi:hypothetical protein
MGGLSRLPIIVAERPVRRCFPPLGVCSPSEKNALLHVISNVTSFFSCVVIVGGSDGVVVDADADADADAADDCDVGVVIGNVGAEVEVDEVIGVEVVVFSFSSMSFFDSFEFSFGFSLGLSFSFLSCFDPRLLLLFFLLSFSLRSFSFDETLLRLFDEDEDLLLSPSLSFDLSSDSVTRSSEEDSSDSAIAWSNCCNGGPEYWSG